MNPHPDRRGGRRRRKTIAVRPKWRGKDGIELTRQARYDGTNKTLQGSDLHGRLPLAGDGGRLNANSLGPSKGKRQQVSMTAEP
jgi:hypothetical protein